MLQDRRPNVNPAAWLLLALLPMSWLAAAIESEDLAPYAGLVEPFGAYLTASARNDLAAAQSRLKELQQAAATDPRAPVGLVDEIQSWSLAAGQPQLPEPGVSGVRCFLAACACAAVADERVHGVRATRRLRLQFSASLADLQPYGPYHPRACDGWLAAAEAERLGLAPRFGDADGMRVDLPPPARRPDLNFRDLAACYDIFAAAGWSDWCADIARWSVRQLHPGQRPDPDARRVWLGTANVSNGVERDLALLFAARPTWGEFPSVPDIGPVRDLTELERLELINDLLGMRLHWEAFRLLDHIVDRGGADLAEERQWVEESWTRFYGAWLDSRDPKSPQVLLGVPYEPGMSLATFIQRRHRVRYRILIDELLMSGQAP